LADSAKTERCKSRVGEKYKQKGIKNMWEL